MPTFAAPLFLWGLLALPIVVLLHRIRVRRERREVAGIFLWRRARDAGARRVRIRPSLLLALQLLAVAAAAIGAARPEWDLAGPPLKVLVIDSSASMAARDGASAAAARDLSGLPPGASRLDLAVQLARATAAAGGPVAIVRAGLEPDLLLPPSGDEDELEAALASLAAFESGSDAERALRLARDLVRGAGAAGAELHWLSDRPPPATADVIVHALAGQGRNVGVSGFERIAGQAWVRISSTWPAPIEAPVELLRGGEVVAATQLLVPAAGSAAATFPVAAGSGPLQARVIPPEGDVLTLDDEAWAGASTTVVVLNRGFAALERALGAIDDVQVRVAASAPRLDADLRILEGRLDREVAPGATTVLLPSRDAPAVAATIERWDLSEPLLRYVDLSALIVAHLDPPPFGAEEQAEGWITLVSGARLPGEVDDPAQAQADAAAADRTDAPAPVAYPLIQRREGAGGAVLRFAFHPARGDLTRRPAFPTLIVNLVDAVRSEDRVALGTPLPPGATRDGLPATVADLPGLYRVDGRTVHASLANESETRLNGPDAFAGIESATANGGRGSAGETQGRDGVGAGVEARRELFAWPLAVALLALLVEWWGFAGGRLPDFRAFRGGSRRRSRR